MCTHDLCFEQNKKNITVFHLKIVIFTAVKNRCILHGRVFVMCIGSTGCLRKTDTSENIYILICLCKTSIQYFKRVARF